MLVASVRLPKASHKTSVPKVAVGRPDDKSPGVGRTQLMTTFIRQEQSVAR